MSLLCSQCKGRHTGWKWPDLQPHTPLSLHQMFPPGIIQNSPSLQPSFLLLKRINTILSSQGVGGHSGFTEVTLHLIARKREDINVCWQSLSTLDLCNCHELVSRFGIIDKFTACTFLSCVAILPGHSEILSRGLIYDASKANVSLFHVVLGGQHFSFNVISS